MPSETTYTEARARFASLWSQVTANRDVVVIHRRGHDDVALVAADELRSLLETAHLLRSPRNAERLWAALRRARRGGGRRRSVEAVRREVGLDR